MGTQGAAPSPNFDRVASVYRWAEYLCLGPLLRRTRERFLGQIGHVHQILALGDGDGRFTARLLRTSAQTKVLAIDASPAMLRLLQGRCQFAAHRLRTLQADFLGGVRQVDLPSFGCLVSHFALDCLSDRELDALVNAVAREARPGLLWLVSDFGIPENPLLRPFARVYVRVLYAAFCVLTGLRTQRLPAIGRALNEHGFVRCLRHQRLQGLLYSELWVLGPPPERPVLGDEHATSGVSGSSTRR